MQLKLLFSRNLACPGCSWDMESIQGERGKKEWEEMSLCWILVRLVHVWRTNPPDWFYFVGCSSWQVVLWWVFDVAPYPSLPQKWMTQKHNEFNNWSLFVHIVNTYQNIQKICLNVDWDRCLCHMQLHWAWYRKLREIKQIYVSVSSEPIISIKIFKSLLKSPILYEL